MSWLRFAPELVLVACMAATATLGTPAAALWLPAIALAALASARALWKRYRDG